MGEFNDGAATQESWFSQDNLTEDLEERDEVRKPADSVRSRGYFEMKSSTPPQSRDAMRDCMLLPPKKYSSGKNSSLPDFTSRPTYSLNARMPSRSSVLRSHSVPAPNTLKRKHPNQSLSNSITQMSAPSPSIRQNGGMGGILEKGGYVKQPASGAGRLMLFFLEIYVMPRKLNNRIISTTAEVDGVRCMCWLEGVDEGNGSDVKTVNRGTVVVLGEGEAKLSQKFKGNLHYEEVKSEAEGVKRIAGIIAWKNPDLLLSWDTQDSGIGYVIERAER